MNDRIWNDVRNRQRDRVVDIVEAPIDVVLDRSVSTSIESTLLINVWDPVMDFARGLKGAFDDTVTG